MEYPSLHIGTNYNRKSRGRGRGGPRHEVQAQRVPSPPRSGGVAAPIPEHTPWLRTQRASASALLDIQRDQEEQERELKELLELPPLPASPPEPAIREEPCDPEAVADTSGDALLVELVHESSGDGCFQENADSNSLPIGPGRGMTAFGMQQPTASRGTALNATNLANSKLGV